jgi:hypothetical protein
MAKPKKAAPKFPVTAEHVREFEGYLVDWLSALNLNDWRAIFDPRPTKNLSEVFGFDRSNKIVRYRLGSDWKYGPVTSHGLRSVALHEALHVRLHDLAIACEEKGNGSTEVEEAEHEVVIVLEKLIMRLAGEADKGSNADPAAI